MAGRDKSIINGIMQMASRYHADQLADVFRLGFWDTGLIYGPHTHKRIEINYVKKGSCTMCFGSTNVEYSEGEMVIIAPNVPHQFITGPKGVLLLQLEFQPELLMEFYTQEDIAADDNSRYDAILSQYKHIKLKNNIRLSRTVERIVFELTEKKENYQFLVFLYYAELQTLISRYFKDKFSNSELGASLQQALKYIENNYYNDLTVAEIASASNMNERTMRNHFTRKLNMSPNDYLIAYRVNKAKDLLKYSNLSIKEVAHKTGFNSPNYFSEAFARLEGISPKIYKTQVNCKRNEVK